jgi:hypothetical protein
VKVPAAALQNREDTMSIGPDDLDEVDDTDAPDDPSWAGRIAAHIAGTPEVPEDPIVRSEN